MDQQQRDDVARQIKTHREARGWSPERLAEEAGLSDKTVRSLEAGNNVRPGSLGKVLAALGIEPIAEVVERRGEPADVHGMLEVLRVLLMGMPEADRPEVIADVIRYLWGQR